MSRIALGFVLTLGAFGVPTVSRPAPQISWTCPICHQTFQFDRRDTDHMRNWTANHLAMHGSGPAPPPYPPPVPGYLIDVYRQARSRLDRVTSSQLPEFSQPSTLTDLYYAVVRLRKIAEEELDQLTSEESELTRRLRDLTEEIESNKNRISELGNEIQGLRSEISSLESAIRGAESKKAAQSELHEKLSQVTTTMEEQAASFRQSFYSRLREAQSRGLIAPPSSYRTLPSPVPPRYEEREVPRLSPNIAVREPPVYRRPMEPRIAPRALAREPQRAAPTRESVTETRVKDELDTIDGLVPRLASARRDRDAARKRLAQPEQQAAEQRAEIDRLGNQKETAESRKASLSEARDKIGSDLSELASKLRHEADDAIRKWVVRSFWKSADKYAQELLAQSGSEHSATWFPTFRKVMTHTVDFGNDVFTVIGKTPEASVKDEWGQLEVELNQAVEKFKLNLFLDYTSLPRWLQSLVPKGDRPWRNADH